MSFAMLEGKCYCCGKAGHKSPTCRLKDKTPKEEWAINKAKAKEPKEQSHVTTEQQTSTKSDNNSENSAQGWCGAHIQLYQANDMKKWILLDNGSTVDFFCNPKMVNNITQTKETLELATNGGDLRTNKRANVPGYGEVWYDEKAITNIFSFEEMDDKHRITYDSLKEKSLVVH